MELLRESGLGCFQTGRSRGKFAAGLDFSPGQINLVHNGDHSLLGRLFDAASWNHIEFS